MLFSFISVTAFILVFLSHIGTFREFVFQHIALKCYMNFIHPDANFVNNFCAMSANVSLRNACPEGCISSLPPSVSGKLNTFKECYKGNNCNRGIDWMKIMSSPSVILFVVSDQFDRSHQRRNGDR